MLSKKYLPSVGFVVLSFTILSSVLFMKWALSPLSYEKAALEEQLGHQLVKKGKAKEASKHFLTAALIEDNNISRSRRYRCAGSTSREEKDKIKYYQLALKYNPDNKIARNELKPFFSEIRYKNRSADGWSMGKNAKAVLNVLDEKATYALTYFTNSPTKSLHKVKIAIDRKLVKAQEVKQSKINEFVFSLDYGKHTIDIFINKTFNPMKLKMSKDNRDLGVYFEIKKEKKK